MKPSTTPPAPRPHGGNLDAAIQAYGGDRARWIDLSTGINRRPYPLPRLPPDCWARLPEASATARFVQAARGYTGAGAAVEIVPAPGAQALIQACPLLRPPGRVGIVTPTYNEHEAAFAAAGWDVVPLSDVEDLRGLDALVVVNPNNPDGRCYDPADLLARAGSLDLLVVDESFADTAPALSAIPHLSGDLGTRTVVMRSFGKFFGLAGLRLGFAACTAPLAHALAERLGPWAVSGPALEVGARAYADAAWIEETRARLAVEAARLDALAAEAGWRLIGGTTLFRTYDVGDGVGAQSRLARQQIWSRTFPYAPGWLRLGIPSGDDRWPSLR
ncbi:MAG: threonine-phosphate decarboxylase CobD [Pseudomonadota bacterium]